MINLFEIFGTIAINANQFIQDISKASEKATSFGTNVSDVVSKVSGLNAPLDKVGDSSETLANKQKMLESILEKNISTVDKLTDAFNKSAQEKGVDSQETQDLATELDKAEKEVKDTENALKKLTDETSKLGKEMDGAEKKTSSFSDKMKTLGEGLENIGKGISDFGGKLTLGITTPLVAIASASAKTFIDFESAFAGVRKTVDATEEQFQELSDGIRNMAKEIPMSASNIAELAESAGQLGIKTENILDFTRVVADLGVATNIVGQEGAAQIARFANIVGMSQTDFDKFGSSIVALGNNFATTESEILDMSMRLAGAGAQVGLSEADILGLATALSSVGIEAEMGGSAISKVLVNMSAAGSTADKLNVVMEKTGMNLRELQFASEDMGFAGLAHDLGMTKKELNDLIKQGANLENFGKIAGMTGEEFRIAFEQDAISALQAFIGGLANAEDASSSAIEMLQEMGITEVRLRDSLLRAAGAGDLLTDSVKLSNEAWEENSALTKEAEQRYATFESRISMVVNQLKDVGMQIGEILIPYVEKALTFVSDLAEKFSSLDDNTKKTIITIAGIAAAIGPILTIFGTLISTIGSVSTVISTVTSAISIMGTGAAGATSTITVLSQVFTALTGPVGIAIAAIAGLTTGLALLYNNNESVRNSINSTWENIKSAVIPLIESVQEAFGELIGAIQPLFEEIMPFLQKAFETVMPIVEKLVIGAITELTRQITAGINILTEIIKFITNVFKGDWSSAWENIKNIFKIQMDHLLDMFGGLPRKMLDIAMDIVRNVRDTIVNTDWLQVGSNIISGLVNGIMAGIGAVGSAISNVANSAINMAKSALGIHSPSTIFREIGINTGKGFIKGIENISSKIDKAVSNTFSDFDIEDISAGFNINGSSYSPLQSNNVNAEIATATGRDNRPINIIINNSFNVSNGVDADMVSRKIGQQATNALRSLGVPVL